MGYPVTGPCDRNLIESVPASAVCARRNEPWVLAATILSSSMAFIDGTAVNVALPVLQSGFHASVGKAQWVVESYALFLAALLLPGGALADRLGRKRILAAGVTLFAVASAGCGMARSIEALIVARAVQGIGAALLVPTSLSILGASFSPERRGRAIGTWSAASALTMALGPVLGGWLVEHQSWRAVFYINLPLAAVVLAILRGHVRESRHIGSGRGMDWPGAALAVVALGALVYGLIQSSELGLGHPLVLACLIGGTVALGAFVAVEKRSTQAMMPLGLFRSRLFSGANILTFLLYGALSGSLFFLPFNLLQVQGYSTTAAGAALLPFSVLMFLLSRWSGSLIDRVGARPPLVFGPGLAAVGFALFALPGIGGSYWTTFFPAVSVLGIGMAITVPPLTTSVLAAAGTENSGLGSAVNNAVSRVAGLLAIAVFGAILVHAFHSTLEPRIDRLALDPQTARTILAERTRLGAIELPAGLPPDVADSLRRALAESFVAGFRLVMIGCSVLAAAGALVAFFALREPRKIPVRSGSRRTEEIPA